MRKGKSALFYLAVTLTIFFLFESSTDKALGAEEKYPARPIDLSCGFVPGGQSDLITRFLTKGLEKYLNVPVVPGNKPGAGGVVSATALVNSQPDGYTLAVVGDADLVTAILLGRATFSRKDFRIIGQFVFISNVLAVSTESPWKKIDEFMDHARKNPGLTYSHPGMGSSPHIRAEYFNKIANVQMKGVPFKGDTEGIAAVLGKHVSMGVFSFMAAKTQADAGKMRILFCFDPPGLGPDPTLPNIPSFFGDSVKNIEPVSQYLVAPAKTPEPIVRTLEQALEKVTKDHDFINNLKKMYVGIQFIDGKTVSEKGLDEKTMQVKAILQGAGLLK